MRVLRVWSLAGLALLALAGGCTVTPEPPISEQRPSTRAGGPVEPPDLYEGELCRGVGRPGRWVVSCPDTVLSGKTYVLQAECSAKGSGALEYRFTTHAGDQIEAGSIPCGELVEQVILSPGQLAPGEGVGLVLSSTGGVTTGYVVIAPIGGRQP